MISAYFQSDGHSPLSIDVLKIMYKGVQRSYDNDRRTAEGMLYYVGVVCSRLYYVIWTYNVSKSLRVPFTLVILVCYSLPTSLQL